MAWVSPGKVASQFLTKAKEKVGCGELTLNPLINENLFLRRFSLVHSLFSRSGLILIVNLWKAEILKRQQVLCAWLCMSSGETCLSRMCLHGRYITGMIVGCVCILGVQNSSTLVKACIWKLNGNPQYIVRICIESSM